MTEECEWCLFVAVAATAATIAFVITIAVSMADDMTNVALRLYGLSQVCCLVAVNV